jgi:transcriptional regulator with XRE-family HTH domain
MFLFCFPMRESPLSGVKRMMNGLGASADQQLALGALVSKLIQRSGLPQRELVSRTGLSKDQVSRTCLGTRPLKVEEALTLLKAANMPARGAITLALFDRTELAVEWSATGMSRFLELLIETLPEALWQELGDDLDHVNPRWGQHAARFVAQRIAHHIRELVEREAKLGEFEPRREIKI